MGLQIMSVNDPVEVVYNEKREGWMLLRGRETFYTHDRELFLWDTAEDAAQWCRDVLRVEPEVKND